MGLTEESAVDDVGVREADFHGMGFVANGRDGRWDVFVGEDDIAVDLERGLR